MGLQRSGERGDGRQQPLLQSDEGQLRQRHLLSALHAKLAILSEQSCELQLRRILGQAGNRDRRDDPFRERLAETAEVGLQAAHHHRLQIPRPDFDAPGEPLRIEHLQERGEAVGMPVVRGSAQEQPVLEALCEFTDRLRQLA